MPVSVAGNSLAPDGQPRKGLLSVPERIVDDGMGGEALERFESLRIPAADVLTVTRHSVITVDGLSRTVVEKLSISDGYTASLQLKRV